MKTNLPFPSVKLLEGLLFVDAHLGYSPEQVSCVMCLFQAHNIHHPNSCNSRLISSSSSSEIVKESVHSSNKYLVIVLVGFCLLTIWESALSFSVSLRCLEEPPPASSVFSDNPLHVSIYN